MTGEGSFNQRVSGFSEAQHSELVDKVSAAIRRHYCNHVQDQLQRDPRSCSAPAIVAKELNPEEVGFDYWMHVAAKVS